MTTPEVLTAVRNAVEQHDGDEQELLNALCEMSETWHSKLDELLDDQDDEDDIEDEEFDIIGDGDLEDESLSDPRL